MAWCSLAQLSTDPASPYHFLTPDPIPCPTAPCSPPCHPHLTFHSSAIPLPQPHQHVLVPSCASTSPLPAPALPCPLPTGPTPSPQLQQALLSFRWALWFFKNDKSKMWQANLRLVTKFSTVEDFWALYTHIQLASKLTSGCDYSLFKDGIEPMWEDSQNKRGGRWLITLAKQQRHTELDRFWLETLLCLIGEMFDEYSDEVCGAVINIRAKGDKIAIWTREAENREGVTHIGRVYKEHLGLSQKVAIGYQAHADTATKSGSLTKNKFVV
uniref:Eukaryotic translation initiation factor 4E family member 1B n=1 Tax=Pavo cristatus TaxID=9049 RepID=A0A8C9EVM9_PAVCR